MNETFMIRKNHPLLKEINAAIEAQQVLIQRVFKKYIDFRIPTTCNQKEKKQIRALCKYLFAGIFGLDILRNFVKRAILDPKHAFD
jgi:hypothetical protein